MELRLKPESEAFILEQVRLGHWRSVEEVIEAGLARLMLDPAEEDMDDQTFAAIEASEEQFDRGEGIPIEDAARLVFDSAPDRLDAADRVAIRQSLEQIERGQVIDATKLGEQLTRRYPRKSD